MTAGQLIAKAEAIRARVIKEFRNKAKQELTRLMDKKEQGKILSEEETKQLEEILATYPDLGEK